MASANGGPHAGREDDEMEPKARHCIDRVGRLTPHLRLDLVLVPPDRDQRLTRLQDLEDLVDVAPAIQPLYGFRGARRGVRELALYAAADEHEVHAA